MRYEGWMWGDGKTRKSVKRTERRRIRRMKKGGNKWRITSNIRKGSEELCRSEDEG